MEQFIKANMSKTGIAEIVFSNPPHNALNSAMLAKLTEEIISADQNDNVQIIVVKSGGERAFCAGASFDELMTIKNEQEGFQFFMGFANLINAIRKSRCLVIGMVQGKTVGGGVGLASAFDYCFATNYAAIKLSELSIGIGPFVISPAVIRKIGKTAFAQLTLNPFEFKSAEWAFQKGLYSEVFDSQEEMEEACIQLVEKLAATNPEARAEIKQTMWKGTEDWDALFESLAKKSGKLVLSEFTQTALSKFRKD
ncbi:MAG: methylglutaconyl-CoA hydratase [Nonlabens sp.]|jgi:methylglutaconyl-CoA hydratase